MVENPFLTVKKPQEVSWMHLINGEYCFELICPFKAIAEEFADGGYLRICAEVKKEAKGLYVSEMIMLNLPVKTLMRGWMAISSIFRQKINAEDNLLMSFKRTSQSALIITDIDRLRPTPEHLEFFTKYNIKREKIIYKVKIKAGAENESK